MPEQSFHPAANSNGSYGLAAEKLPTAPERGILVNAYILYRRGVRLSVEERGTAVALRGRLVIADGSRARRSRIRNKAILVVA